MIGDECLRFSGMGTKVQCKNYFPGYQTMRDLNEGASSSWSVYCDDMSPSGRLYNGFTPRPLNGYAECDKETFKQTMLKQDTIFRKQVYELHRLYKIQKNMMDDLKRKEQCNYAVKVMTPQSLPFSSENPCNGTERMWHLSQSSDVNANCSRPSVSAFDDVRYPLSLLQESNTQGGPRIPTENEGSTMDEKLIGSRVRKFPRRMLDLELPAEAYIDTEDTEPTHEKNDAEMLFGATDSVNSNCDFDFEPENDVKLTLSTGEGPSCVEERCQSDSRLQNGPHARNLADLNEPVEEISFEEAAISSFSKCPGPTTPFEDMQGRQVPLKSKPRYLSPLKDFLQDRHRDEGTCSILLHADEGEKRPEWSFFNNEPRPMRSNGESLTQSYNGKLPTSSEPPILKPIKLHGLSSSDISNQNKTEAWFREKPALGVENSVRSPLASTSYLGPTASPVPGALSDVSYSWRKTGNSISHLPIAVKALPCIYGSAPFDMHSRSSSKSIQSPSNACDKWQYKRDCKLYQGLGSESSSYPNGFHHNLQSETNASSHLHSPSISFDKPNLNDGDNSACESLEGHDYQKYSKGLNCMDVKSAKDVNLNVELPNGFHDKSTPQQSLVSDVEGKYDHLFGRMSWLRKKLSCSESIGAKQGVNPAQSYSQTVENCGVVAREFDRKRETGNSSCLDVLKDFPLALSASDTRIQRNDTDDNPSNKKILGFSIDDRTHLTTNISTSISCREHAVTDDAKSMKEGSCHTDCCCEIKLLDLEKQTSMDQIIEKSVGNSVTCFRDKINLNSMATREDQLSTEISLKDEADAPSPLTVASVAVKIASKIDLEVPLGSHAEEHVPFMEESLEINLRATPVETLRLETDDPPETKNAHETIARVAAQTMVSLSLDKCNCSDDITGRMLAPDLANSLNWFADIVTSNADDLEGKMGVARREEDSAHESTEEGVESVDYFEFMTLKLRETKIEEYCRPWECKDQKDEETGVASMLLTKPRKGQARRRRQRRDFQKDILPGLVSLSRYEVTEDIQMIGGLMRASGQSWNSSASRRKMGRNGGNSQARGRRRPRGSTAAVVENPVDPPPPPQPKQCNNTELEIDGRSIMGWGRTTRRCRRQRCPLGNATAPLT